MTRLELPNDPPRAYGNAVCEAIMRSSHDDFVVDEVLGFAPEGVGQHVLLRIRKTGIDTAEAVRRIAALVGVPQRNFGHAGLKDRNAVCTQWLSFDTAGAERADASLDGCEGIELLERHAHDRKLRPGSHAANRFALTLRGVRAGADAVTERLEKIRANGVPNYFGPQRFGRNGANVAGAERFFSGASGRRRRKPARAARARAFSTARALLFNHVLAERVVRGDWDRIASGDVANLDGRGSVFPVDAADATLAARCAAGEIHPTGPLWGTGDPLVAGEIDRLETSVCGRSPLAGALEEAGAQRARRALRVIPRAMGWDLRDDAVLVRFELPPGAYATSVLREAFDILEPDRSPEA